MLLARGAPPCSVHYLLKSSQTKNKAFPELIKLMIENGATVDFPENPFLEFFQHLNGRNQFVWRSFSIILEHCQLDIKLQTNDGRINVLHWIASTGYYVNPENRAEIDTIIDVVLNRDPSLRDEKTIALKPVTPLQLALQYGTWYLAQGLIKKGAQVKGLQPSPIQLMVRHVPPPPQKPSEAALETFDLLKGTLDQYQGDGNLICECGTTELARAAIKAGADPHFTDGDGRSILFYVESAQVAKMLGEEFNLSPHARDSRGRNVLVECKTLDAAKFFVTLGVRPEGECLSPSQQVVDYLKPL